MRVRSVHHVLSVLVAAATGVGCVPYGARPGCPASGGSAWHEVDTTNFRVVSDLDVEEEEDVARELEEGLAAIGTAAFAGARLPVEPTTVVVFSHESDFRAFAPELVDGRFYRSLPNDLEPSRTIVMHGALGTSSRVACLHELTHDLFDRNFGWAPPWLREGWAEYYSTIRIEDGRIVTGAVLPGVSFTAEPVFSYERADDGSMAEFVPFASIPPPSELVHLDSAAFYRSVTAQSPTQEDRERTTSLYVGAWALVHLLTAGPPSYRARFEAFREEASRRTDLRVAYDIAFGSLDPKQFDQDFREYLSEGRFAELQRPLPKEAIPVHATSRLLTDAEVHVLWARLSPWTGAAGASARADLDEAVRVAPSSADPRYFRALFHRTRGDVTAATADLDEALRLRPNDPRLWLARVVLLTDAAQNRTDSTSHDPRLLAAMSALAQTAKTATQLRIVAEMLHELGQAERGMEVARRAKELDPIDPFVLDTYATLLNDVGRVTEALAVQRNAVAFLPEEYEAASLVAHLQAYAARLAAPVGAAE